MTGPPERELRRGVIQSQKLIAAYPLAITLCIVSREEFFWGGVFLLSREEKKLL